MLEQPLDAGRLAHTPPGEGLAQAGGALLGRRDDASTLLSRDPAGTSPPAEARTTSARRHFTFGPSVLSPPRRTIRCNWLPSSSESRRTVTGVAMQGFCATGI
ncbi:MAG TPA: hypothetical protein VII19_02505, partial [Acidimicrobiales bacterium]